MSWHKATIKSPIPTELQGIASSLSSFISTVGTVLNVISTAIDVIKNFVTTTVDPFKTLVGTLLNELESFNNNLFSTGIYTLVVSPFDKSAPIEHDALGIPKFPVQVCLQRAIDSFSDICDVNRPQFDNSATVSAFGVLITAPTIDGFLGKIGQLKSIIDFGGLSRIEKKYNRLNTSGCASTLPDWHSIRLNSISQLAQYQTIINDFIHQLRGYYMTADDNLTDLVNLLNFKVDALQNVLSALNFLISQLINVTGVFVLSLPPSVGGVERIKQEMRDSYLEGVCLTYSFSMMVLFVGGGASAVVVDKLRRFYV